MKRAIVLCASIIFFAAALPCEAQSTADKAALLLQRLADQSGSGTAEVTIGALPTEAPKVPLPDADIVGSVYNKGQSGFPQITDRYEIYYNGNADTLTKYVATLTSGGWAAVPFGLSSHGGFTASAGEQATFYCKADAPIVSAQLGSGANDLRVSISARGGAMDVVCSGGDVLRSMMASVQAPLPDLHAPAGVRMSVSQIVIPTGKSGAFIEGATSPSALLDAFAAQMIKAGWTAGATSANSAIGSQTFQIIDEKKTTWQCVLTIYALDGKPGKYIALIDATNPATLTRSNAFAP